MTRIAVAHVPAEMGENPYCRLLYGNLAERGIEPVGGGTLRLSWLLANRRRIQVLHFHWDERYHESKRGPRTLRVLRAWAGIPIHALRLRAARALGYRLVWTIHEVYRHETTSRRVDLVHSRQLGRASDAVIAHDEATAARAVTVLGLARERIEIVPHGSYLGAYPPGRSRAEVRELLGVPGDAFAFLCFGQLRACKEIERLLDAFAAAPADAALVVAGRPWSSETAERLHRAAAADPRIRLRLGFVPESEVAELFEAADAFTLPRGDGWTSGSIVLALSLGLPVVAARRPAYAELLGGEDAGWLFEPGDTASLTAALARAAGDPDGARARGEAARRRALTASWDAAAGQTASLLAGTRRSRR